jgi:hypothetical protein
MRLTMISIYPKKDLERILNEMDLLDHFRSL